MVKPAFGDGLIKQRRQLVKTFRRVVFSQFGNFFKFRRQGAKTYRAFDCPYCGKLLFACFYDFVYICRNTVCLAVYVISYRPFDNGVLQLKQSLISSLPLKYNTVSFFRIVTFGQK